MLRRGKWNENSLRRILNKVFSSLFPVGYTEIYIYLMMAEDRKVNYCDNKNKNDDNSQI